MAYKFQFGATKLSGSTTFEEALVGESSISGSGRLSGKELILDAVGVIGTSGDADLLTLSANSLVVAGDLSASIALAGKDVLLDDGGKIGVAADTDLLTLTDGIVTVAGDVKAVELSGSSTLSVEGASSFGPGALTTINAAGVISGSGVSTLYSVTTDALIAGTADINGGTADNVVIGGGTAAAGTFTTVSASSTLQAAGVVTAGNGKFSITAEGAVDINDGAIDGTTVGATTQASGEFTTLSASSTLNVVGASNFGPGNLASISAAGVVSGSGNSTLHRLDSNQLVFGSGSLNGPLYINKLAGDVDEIMGLGSGSLLYHDEATGKMKLGSFSSYALAIAGTGITATDGVLSVDTTGGDSMSATHIPADAGGNATLSVGINFMTTEVTGSSLLLLPSASAGDVVIVKAPAGVSSTNFVKISSSVAQGDEIDGFSEARIESPFGAVSMVYSNSDGKWVIY